MRSFIIPSADNTISDADIKSGILRITTEFKEYFPGESGELMISYGKSLVENVNFEYREGRSHRLSVGKAFMTNLGLASSSRLKFTELIPKKHFLIEKL